MNKRDLVGKIAGEARLTRAQAAQALESLLEAIRSSLTLGDRVTISGFGTFAVSYRKQRHVRDPRRGVTMVIEARSVPRFAPGLELRAAVAKSCATKDNSEQDHSLHTRSS